MQFLNWFRNKNQPKLIARAKGTKKTFKLSGLDICLRWVRCRGCGGKVGLVQDGIDRLEIKCPGCGQKSRLVVMPSAERNDVPEPKELG